MFLVVKNVGVSDRHSDSHREGFDADFMYTSNHSFIDTGSRHRNQVYRRDGLLLNTWRFISFIVFFLIQAPQVSMANKNTQFIDIANESDLVVRASLVSHTADKSGATRITIELKQVVLGQSQKTHLTVWAYGGAKCSERLGQFLGAKDVLLALKSPNENEGDLQVCANSWLKVSRKKAIDTKNGKVHELSRLVHRLKRLDPEFVETSPRPIKSASSANQTPVGLATSNLRRCVTAPDAQVYFAQGPSTTAPRITPKPSVQKEILSHLTTALKEAVDLDVGGVSMTPAPWPYWLVIRSTERQAEAVVRPLGLNGTIRINATDPWSTKLVDGQGRPDPNILDLDVSFEFYRLVSQVLPSSVVKQFKKQP